MVKQRGNGNAVALEGLPRAILIALCCWWRMRTLIVRSPASDPALEDFASEIPSEWLSSVLGHDADFYQDYKARQFANARLVNDIQDALQQTGVDPSRLQLEITESIAAADPTLTVTVLSPLKHLGIGVILDDFLVGEAKQG